jgi:hypothetical protein
MVNFFKHTLRYEVTSEKRTGLVSRDFEVCFWYPWISSDGACLFAFKISCSYRIFRFSRLGVGTSLHCELSCVFRLSAGSVISPVMGPHYGAQAKLFFFVGQYL